MLHLQTSNQSPATFQFGIFASVAALVVVAVVPAVITLSDGRVILIFILFLMTRSSSSANVKPELMYLRHQEYKA